MMTATDMMLSALTVSLFYGFAVTALVYGLCDGSMADPCGYVTGFASEGADLTGVGAEVENALTQQTNLPVVELGALLFYSGNIFLDLILNFLTAVPQMFGLLVTAIMMLFSVDAGMVNIIQIFVTVCASVFYIIACIVMLTNVRSGRVVG